jgi:hypothetical protein
VLRALWAKRVDVLANLAPAGLLGLGYLRLLPLMLVVLLANTLSSGARFAEPLFQTLPVYLLLPVGSVAVLAWLAARYRRTALVLAALLAVQAVGWAVVWGPRTPAQWLRVSAPAAATLAAVQARIPATAEVIASQGVVGRFSGRRDVHELAHTGSTPVTSADVWFVITPTTGVELEPVAGALALIGKLAGRCTPGWSRTATACGPSAGTPRPASARCASRTARAACRPGPRRARPAPC